MTNKHAVVWSWMLAFVIMVGVIVLGIAHLLDVLEISHQTFLTVFYIGFMAGILLTALHFRLKMKVAI